MIILGPLGRHRWTALLTPMLLRAGVLKNVRLRKGCRRGWVMRLLVLAICLRILVLRKVKLIRFTRKMNPVIFALVRSRNTLGRNRIALVRARNRRRRNVALGNMNVRTRRIRRFVKTIRRSRKTMRLFLDSRLPRMNGLSRMIRLVVVSHRVRMRILGTRRRVPFRPVGDRKIRKRRSLLMGSQEIRRFRLVSLLFRVNALVRRLCLNRRRKLRPMSITRNALRLALS